MSGELEIFAGTGRWRDVAVRESVAADRQQLAIDAQGDAALTARVTKAVFREEYETRYLPGQLLAWELAVEALLKHGRPTWRSYRHDSRGTESPLSTGLLMLDDPVGLGNGDISVPAIRLSVPGAGFGNIKFFNALRAYHRKEHSEKRRARVAAMIRSIDVEVCTVTNNEDRIPPASVHEWQREVAYPRNWREAHEVNPYTSQRRRRLLQDAPDTACWTWALGAFEGAFADRITLERPVVARGLGGSTLEGARRVAEIEARNASELIDMLHSAQDPVALRINLP